MGKVKFRPKTRVLTGREARRYGAREMERERRQEEANRFWALSPEERALRVKDAAMMERIQKNGITIEDMHEIEVRAAKEGYDRGLEHGIRTSYAAICLALNELHGFGKQRCEAVLNAVDEKMVYTLTSEEAIQEVWDRMKLRINFKEPVPGERIVEAE
jgi:hypothetical protein